MRQRFGVGRPLQLPCSPDQTHVLHRLRFWSAVASWPSDGRARCAIFQPVRHREIRSPPQCVGAAPCAARQHRPNATSCSGTC